MLRGRAFVHPNWLLLDPTAPWLAQCLTMKCQSSWHAGLPRSYVSGC